MEQIIKNAIEKINVDELGVCKSREKFVKIIGKTNHYVILDISKDNLVDWYKAINYNELKGILVFFTFGHQQILFDYYDNKIKPLFV